MSDTERRSDSDAGAAQAQPKSAVKPNPAKSSKSEKSSDSGYTISNTQGVSFTRLSRIRDTDDLSPAISDLPTELTGDRARFWHTWTGQPFQGKVGNRGSGGENGRNWTFATFVTSYCDKFHPSLTPNERCQYEAILGQKVYNFLYNSTKRSSRPHADSDDEDKDLEPSRVLAADLWVKDKPKEYQKKLEAYYEEHPGTERNPGLRRSATFKVYNTLTDAERSQYQKMADDAMERIKKGQELEGQEAEKYSRNFPKTLKKLLSKAEKAVGAQALVFLMTEESSTKRNITILSSDGFREFSKINAPMPTISSPRPCVYPDGTRNNKPSVPDLAGLRASDLQDIHRDYWKQLLAYMGGGSRFPWEEIAKDPTRWLGGKLPGDFKDPGGHDRHGNFAWLECLLAGQKDDIPLADRIFIRRIHAADPIDQSESEEVSRERVMYQGREVWELTFDKPITKCHARKALSWPDGSLLYANYIRTGPIAGSYSNPHQLPICPNTKTHLVLIDGELYDGVIARANQLADGKDEVLGLVDAYNEFASHLPAETTRGAWDGQPVPLLFSAKPPTQPPTVNFLLREYLPLSYYQSVIQAQKEGTLGYFEMWIELVLSGKLLYHGPSSTLLGGITGCIWAVLGVVLILFNVAYVRGDAKPPFSPPENYDLSRLPTSEWDRVGKWCRQLAEALNDGTRVLSLTSLHRLKGTLPITRAPVEDLALGEDPVQTDLLDANVTQSPPTSPKPPNKSNRPKSTRNKTKGKGEGKGKGKPRRAQATESESGDEFSSDRGSDSSDYDRKDKSDEGSSEDDSQLDVDEGTHGHGTDGGGVKSIRRLLPKDFNPRECPWGGFPDPKVRVNLPDYIAPETLLPPMRSAYDQLDAALQEWHQNTLKADDLQAERSYGTSEQNNPVLSDPRSGPMYATILTRELVWNVRKAQGETLYPILERLKTASSTAVQHSLAWVEFIKSTESLGDKGPDLGELNNLGKRLRMKTIEACWIYDEMLDYAHLATAMHKMMDWSPDPQQRPTPDSPDIRKHAVWCKDWAEATEELEGEMIAHRREYWRKTGRPFEKQFSKPSPYKFGNAVKEEWHQAFEACLALSEAPVPPSTPTPVAPSPTVNPEVTDESATTQPEEEPTVDKMAQPEESPAVDEMEQDPQDPQDPQDNAMANETEPDMPTEPTTSASRPDASHSTAGKATKSTSNKRGRKSGPGKQVPPPADAQETTGVIQRETRANAKRKAEEAQQTTRKSLRRK